MLLFPMTFYHLVDSLKQKKVEKERKSRRKRREKAQVKGEEV